MSVFLIFTQETHRNVKNRWVRSSLKSVIYTLNGYDQNKYVSGCLIGESIRLTDDMLKYADKEKEDGIMFTADIDKAFDSVEYYLIFATLTKTQQWQSVH